MHMNPRPINNAGQLARFAAMTLAMLFSLSVFGQQTAPAEQTTPEQDENVVVLSPFVVTTEKDVGYFAENTLAGSRMNTKVSDLAASITVVTKQQLEDTGSLDINDVFLYEANTEGAGTFTPVAMNRNNLTDNIGGYSGDDGSPFGIATANRVRGLGRVDTAQNNYPTIARLAFDAYNTNSVEINRGPNSMLFGFGSPAGIVNQSRATAVVDKDGGQVEMRIGSWGSERASISGNKTLIDGKLAVYGAALYDKRGFQRKPLPARNWSTISTSLFICPQFEKFLHIKLWSI